MPPAGIAALVGIAVIAVVVAALFGTGVLGGDDESAAVQGSDTLEPLDDLADLTADLPSDEPGGTAEEPVTTSGTEPETSGPVEAIVPVSAEATAERRSVELRCTDEVARYTAAQIIDGDLNTGWGASASDGTGESVTLRFDGEVHLTQVGLTPGFAKFGPRLDTDCQSVPAFDLNRWVPRVEYTFDDGTSVVHELRASEELQYRELDVRTTSVTITILETVRPPGADDDTILSEVVFEGRRP